MTENPREIVVKATLITNQCGAHSLELLGFALDEELDALAVSLLAAFL